MKQPAYRTAIEEYIRIEARPADKFSHQPRLYLMAKELGCGLDFDDDVLHASAWLHDLGVFVGHRPEHPEELARWDNVRYALEKAPLLLAGWGFPSEKIPAVVEAIRTHQPQGEPGSVEAILLRDADILEQLGAIAIVRTVSKVGRDTRFPTHADAVKLLRRNAEYLPGKLRLPEARHLAQARLQVMQAFFDGCERESRGWL